MEKKYGAADDFHKEFPKNSPFAGAILAHEQTPEPEEAGSDVYLLGGGDYEMERIRKRLGRVGAETVDHGLGWEGADVKVYEEKIARIQQEGKTPVAIELRGADTIPGLVEIDHHNGNSEKPASLMQVLERLGIEPGLVEKLAAANDAGYYPAMEALVKEELYKLEQKGYEPERLKVAEVRMAWLIEAVRRKDREAQGVTEEMEKEAELAIEIAEHGPNRLVIVKLTGDKPSPVTDRLIHTWKDGKQNLIVICNGDKAQKEVWFFGSGKICKNTVDHYRSKKQKRLNNMPGDPERSGVYHAWGGGRGFAEGDKDANTMCGIVAENPEEVIKFIEAAQSEAAS